MTEPEVEKFKLEVQMNATITVFDAAGNPTDWLRPGTTASCTWRGIPSEVELALRYKDLSTVASATLEDVLVSTRQRLDQARRGG